MPCSSGFVENKSISTQQNDSAYIPTCSGYLNKFQLMEKMGGNCRRSRKTRAPRAPTVSLIDYGRLVNRRTTELDVSFFPRSTISFRFTQLIHSPSERIKFNDINTCVCIHVEWHWVPVVLVVFPFLFLLFRFQIFFTLLFKACGAKTDKSCVSVCVCVYEKLE